MKKPSFEMLTGRTEDHLVLVDINDYPFKIHTEIKDDLYKWSRLCQNQGIDFAVASGFRSYERQLLIWNEKVQGKRALKNADGQIVHIQGLTEQKILDLILLWSHIPGSSRHHWGTDLDVFDATWYKQQKKKLELENYHYLGFGPSAKFHCYNEELLTNKNIMPFYRPYNDSEHKSFMPELWHYSHQKVAATFEQTYTLKVFVRNLELSNELLLRDLILTKPEYYFKKFVTLC